jgi:hypothetical protein
MSITSRRLLVVGLVLIGVIVASMVTIFIAIRTSTEVLDDSYAIQLSSRLFVYFLEHNPDKWPSSWEDLEPGYAIVRSEGGYEISFSDVKHRVDIDFAMTEEKFLSNPNSRILRLAGGRYAHFAGEDPNDYIRWWCEHRRTKETDIR